MLEGANPILVGTHLEFCMHRIGAPYEGANEYISI